MRMAFMTGYRLLRLQGWCKSCVGRRLLCSSMAFFGRFMAIICCVKVVRPLRAVRAELPGVAMDVEIPTAGIMEQDPSPACTAWASPGLLLTLPWVFFACALSTSCTWTCSHTSTESGVCALAEHQITQPLGRG